MHGVIIKHEEKTSFPFIVYTKFGLTQYNINDSLIHVYIPLEDQLRYGCYFLDLNTFQKEAQY